LKGTRLGAHASWAAAWTLLFTARSPHQISHCTKFTWFLVFWCSCNEQTSLQRDWSENT